MSVTGKSVTITLSAKDHYTHPLKPLFEEGQKIKLAKHLWERTQRTKNKRTVCRLLRKEFIPPYIVITKVNDGDFETTLTLKKINY